MFELKYHHEVFQKDIPKLPLNIKKRIKTAIEQRLATAPQDYGVALRRTLKGYSKLRVGDYRVIFKILKTQVIIYKIGHRKEVYKFFRKV